MIRNAFAIRLASLAGVALSVAGLGALDAAAQGTVTLSGGTGTSCQYSGISIAPNGNLTVTCQATTTPVPVCTITGPSSAQVNSPFTLTANCSNGPITSYAWTATGGAPVPSGAGGNVTIATANTYTYAVAATNANGAGPVSTGFSVNVQAPAIDVPRNCTFSATPPNPVVGESTTLTMNCTNSPNAFAWYQYEGPTLSMPNQTTVGTQTVSFPSSGTYRWWLQAGNNMGGGDVFSGSVTVGSAVGGCPAVETVAPASSASLLQLLFALKPGQIGSQAIPYPLDGFGGIKVTGTAATGAETPPSTRTVVTLATCPGQFEAPYVEAGCTMEIWGQGQSTMTAGQAVFSTCPLASGHGTKYLNIKHTTCVPSGWNGINYCANNIKAAGTNN